MENQTKSPTSGQAGRASEASSFTADSHNDNAFTISDGNLLRALLVGFELWALKRVRSGNAPDISEKWLIGTIGVLKWYVDKIVYEGKAHG